VKKPSVQEEITHIKKFNNYLLEDIKNQLNRIVDLEDFKRQEEYKARDLKNQKVADEELKAGFVKAVLICLSLYAVLHLVGVVS